MTAPRKTIDTVFWPSVTKTPTCWLWTGPTSGNGYGRVYMDRRSRTAHRVSYEATIGPIPEGLQLDHLCRTRGCVNPAHLEPVTPRENTRRGTTGQVTGDRKKASTHCQHGHEYTPENTHHYSNGVRAYRRCRRCARASKERQHARRVAQAEAVQ